MSADPSQYSIYYWLAAGAIFLLFEAFGVPGIGAFFAGMAALCVSSTIALGILTPDAYFPQIVWFLGCSIGWGILLWKPLKNMRFNKSQSAYSNIIGERATVSSASLIKGTEGKVTWSGSIFTAELSPTSSVDNIPAGAKVIISGVHGAKLIVDPI